VLYDRTAIKRQNKQTKTRQKRRTEINDKVQTTNTHIPTSVFKLSNSIFTNYEILNTAIK